MGSIRDQHNEWRDSLVVASFRNVFFHVEVSGRMSGRRVVPHEFPKRNDPYAEDMGRHMVRWSFVGYILLNDKFLGNLILQRNRLIEALERDGAGLLQHPTMTLSYAGGADGASPGGPMLVMCERYTVSETREKGGYYEFDMTFVEAGVAPRPLLVDRKGSLIGSAEAAAQAAQDRGSQVMGSTANITGAPGSGGVVTR